MWSQCPRWVLHISSKIQRLARTTENREDEWSVGRFETSVWTVSASQPSSEVDFVIMERAGDRFSTKLSHLLHLWLELIEEMSLFIGYDVILPRDVKLDSVTAVLTWITDFLFQLRHLLKWCDPSPFGAAIIRSCRSVQLVFFASSRLAASVQRLVI